MGGRQAFDRSTLQLICCERLPLEQYNSDINNPNEKIFEFGAEQSHACLHLISPVFSEGLRFLLHTRGMQWPSEILLFESQCLAICAFDGYAYIFDLENQKVIHKHVGSIFVESYLIPNTPKLYLVFELEVLKIDVIRRSVEASFFDIILSAEVSASNLAVTDMSGNSRLI